MTVSDNACALIVQAIASAAAEILRKEESAETSRVGRMAVGRVRRSVHDVYRCLGDSASISSLLRCVLTIMGGIFVKLLIQTCTAQQLNIEELRL